MHVASQLPGREPNDVNLHAYLNADDDESSFVLIYKIFNQLFRYRQMYNRNVPACSICYVGGFKCCDCPGGIFAYSLL